MLKRKIFQGLLLTALTTMWLSSGHAEDGVAVATTSQQPGSKWGVGFGLGLDRGLYKGIDSRTTAIPLLMYDNQYIHLFGNVLDVK